MSLHTDNSTSFKIFSFRDEKSKGRVISLTSTLLTTFYNVFVTGIFYTGFLSMYGMSITDTGILTFIPFLANLLSVFSPKLLRRFPKRKKILLTAKIIFYTLYIIASTIMPQFVIDPRQRLIWFIVILTVAHGFYALFSSGLTTWFYQFYPEDNEHRTKYLMLTQIFSSAMASTILLSSSLLTDALRNSPYQNELILGFRYLAFILVLIDVFIQSKASEYPYLETENYKLYDIFVLPLREKKFFACMLIMFSWSYISSLNNGLWNYHLLNHMHFSYTLINGVAVIYTITLVFLSPAWRKVLRRYSWIKTFGIAILLTVPTELVFFCMSEGQIGVFAVNGVAQHFAYVGANLAYANILYINLPSKDSTAYIAFNTIGTNIFAFLGMLTGTFISGITGDNTIPFLGMEVYSVQFTALIRGICIALLAIILIRNWRIFTPDDQIADLEQQKLIRSKYLHQRKRI